VIPKPQVYATEAAIGLFKKEEVALWEKTNMALKELPNMMDRGVAITLKEKLLEMKKSLVKS
jgi:hypothetical protein